MMNIKKSVCTNLVFPASRRELGEFRRMAAFLKEQGADSLEFYHDGQGRSGVGKILEENQLEGILIGVIPSKEQRLHACSREKENRRKAVALFQACMDEAAANGISVLMINSGAAGPDVSVLSPAFPGWAVRSPANRTAGYCAERRDASSAIWNTSGL